jgi:hypothetical protein
VLVLGPESLRNEVRALPSSDFLALPVFIRDVLTASKLLTAVQQASGRTDDEAGMTGSLSSTASSTCCARWSAWAARHPAGRARQPAGRDPLLDGEVTGATVGSLSGMAALHHLLLWEERPSTSSCGRPSTAAPSTSGPRRWSRSASASCATSPMPRRTWVRRSTVLRADLNKAANAGDTVPAEVGPLVRLFDGQRPLGEVLEESPFRVFDSLRIVSRLVDLAILERVESRSPARASTTPRSRSCPNRRPRRWSPARERASRAAQPERTPP